MGLVDGIKSALIVNIHTSHSQKHFENLNICRNAVFLFLFLFYFILIFFCIILLQWIQIKIAFDIP